MSNDNVTPDPLQTPGLQSFNVGETKKFWGMEENTFCMLMHLSLLSNFVIPIPFIGIILPIVMWSTNKEQSSLVDQHGRNILNFMLSMLIYVVVSVLLIFVLVGVLTTVALVVVVIAFPIIAAVKASSGTCWPYPLCIRFFK